ncbi:hypothetical protein GDO86_019552 [Hymenochirus boettgeri]|uniref:Junctional adhesion molecule A n=1 Tax=Hymenochirus boettgeri TaxID=247094 RepID=A0A8T2IKF5_9PIPI|nr:hypothetical protein GDO86_019552 [Hymenochirus boettgeri]
MAIGMETGSVMGLILILLGYPTWAALDVTIPSAKMEVKEGSPAEFRCSFPPNIKSVRVEWKFVNSDSETSFVFYDGSLTAPYKDRATSYLQGFTLNSVNVNDRGEYSCEVAGIGTDEKPVYGDAKTQLFVIAPPGPLSTVVPSSVRTGSKVELQCLETGGYPEPTFTWYRNKAPLNPKAPNATYTINKGVLTFAQVTPADGGEYYCDAVNNMGKQVSGTIRMDVSDVNVGGIVAAVIVVLLLLAVIGFGVWYAYSRGYLGKKTK